ncbi:MAG: hypothetical protein H7251_06210 [Acetobacteraceae bacterium]|nr:hypothetical protein [Acetobacteraceae bacterium]
MITIDGVISRLSLRVQIGLLAFVGVAASVVLAGFFLYSEHIAERSLDQANLATQVYEDAAGFDRALLLAKKAEKNFIASGKPSEVTAHASAMSEAFAALSDLKLLAKAATDPKLVAVAAQSEAFLADAKTYAAGFADIVILVIEVGGDEGSGLHGKLRGSAHDAEAVLAKLDHPRLLAGQLMLRRDEKDFLLRGTPAYRDAFEQSFDAFSSTLRATDINPVAGAALATSMAAYHADFNKLATLKLMLSDKVARISKFYSTLEPSLTAWKERVDVVRDGTTATLVQSRSDMRARALWVSGAVLLGLAGLAGLIGWGLTRALAAIVTAMERLARDDRGFDLSRMSGRGEIGKMAAALNAFRSAADTATQELGVAAEAGLVAERDKREALVTMAETVEQEASVAMAKVGAMTAQMDGTAQIMADSAGRTTLSAEGAGTAAGLALGTAQTVAAAAEELTSSVGEITRQVTHCNTVTRRAVRAAHDAQGVIATLGAQARRIGNVAGLIREIASRTNLLALNATIEAARAGDAGRGFAVVAGEVKGLAGQTARATEDITRELDAMIAATGSVVEAVGRIDAAIIEVDTISAAIAVAMDQQGDATSEIARSVGETASAAQIVATRIDEVTHEAQETRRHTDALRGDSASLNMAMVDLKTSVIRVVRTSNSDVERRSEARVTTDLPATVILPDGTIFPANLEDLSTGGTLISGVPPTLSGTVQVRIDGATYPAQVVLHEKSGALRLRFTADPAQQARLAALMERLTRPKAAAA